MLTDDTNPILTWQGEKPTISLDIVCHCGERFTVDQLHEAQAHVNSHRDPP